MHCRIRLISPLLTGGSWIRQFDFVSPTPWIEPSITFALLLLLPMRPLRDTSSKGKPSILIADVLAGDQGHLVDDDLFLAECLMPLAEKLEIRSSAASAANMTRRLNVKAVPLREFAILRFSPRFQITLKLLTLPCSRYQDIVLPAFELISVLLFMLCHPRKRVHLIFHNNLAPAKKKRRAFLWTFLMRLAVARAASLLVPSGYQVDYLASIYPKIDLSKVHLRPLNQMGASRFRPPLSDRSRIVLFMGPRAVDGSKPLEPLIDLIKRDTTHRYKYVLRRMETFDAETRAFLAGQPNVDLGSGYVETDEYYRLLSNASWVILTHNLLFEGKLSGVFCDAIAAGTPVIARDMPPHDECFDRFGDMGVLVDFADPAWCDRFLATDFSPRHEAFISNMAACRESCSMEAIRSVFRAALSRA